MRRLNFSLLDVRFSSRNGFFPQRPALFFGSRFLIRCIKYEARKKIEWVIRILELQARKWYGNREYRFVILISAHFSSWDLFIKMVFILANREIINDKFPFGLYASNFVSNCWKFTVLSSFKSRIRKGKLLNDENMEKIGCGYWNAFWK